MRPVVVGGAGDYFFAAFLARFVRWRNGGWVWIRISKGRRVRKTAKEKKS
jgi:hypothetical protein